MYTEGWNEGIGEQRETAKKPGHTVKLENQ